MSAIAFATPAQDVLLRVAATNFDATVYDTDDLSTIRGASLILLKGVAGIEGLLREAFGNLKVQAIESGASVLILSLTGAVDSAAIEKAVRDHLRGSKDLPLQHFCFAVTFDAAAGEIAERIARLETRAAFAQYRTLSAPVFDKPGSDARPSTLSGTLPGTEKGKSGAAISNADLDRREYGRAQRSDFYGKVLEQTEKGRLAARALDDAKLGFVSSLGDLRQRKVGDVALPVSLHGKIALIHLDGNSFGLKRLERLAKGRDPAAKFSAFVREKQADLLAALLTWAMARPDRAMIFHDKDDGTDRLRLETLLWGGDEMIFAVPAYAGWDIVRLLVQELKQWRMPRDIDDKQSHLTHGLGLLFANYKTPIRQLRLLVDDLTTDAKAHKNFNNVQAFALESVDAPDGGLDGARKKLFGLDKPEALHLGGSAAFDFLNYHDQVLELKRRLPRSLAMKLALSATGQEPKPKKVTGLAVAHGSPDWEKFANDQLIRVLSVADAKFVAGALFGDGASGYSPASRAAPLLQLLNLWDYIAPLDADQPEAAQ